LEPLLADVLADRRQPMVADLFAGSCSVARMLHQRGVGVFANDLLDVSYVLQRAYLEPWASAAEEADAMRLLQQLDRVAAGRDGFIRRTYTPAGGRLFFTEENGGRIDAIRQELERARGWVSEKVYYVALACLLHAACCVANTAGTFAAYLKRLKPSALRPLGLDAQRVGIPSYSGSSPASLCHQGDAASVAEAAAQACDLVYLDPPYMFRQYGSYLHLLSTIVAGDCPATYGLVGTRTGWQPSLYCIKRQCSAALRTLLQRIVRAPNRRTSHVLLSYSSEAVMAIQSLVSLLSEFGQVTVHAHTHKRYRSQPGHSSHSTDVLEYLCVVTLSSRAECTGGHQTGQTQQ